MQTGSIFGFISVLGNFFRCVVGDNRECAYICSFYHFSEEYINQKYIKFVTHQNESLDIISTNFGLTIIRELITKMG